MIKEALHLLKKTGQANILVTASSSGIQPNPLIGVYAMGKAAIINMVQWLAIELLEFNIRVNALAPSITRTNMIAREIELGVEQILPKGAIGDPDDVAAMAATICSDLDCKFANG